MITSNSVAQAIVDVTRRTRQNAVSFMARLKKRRKTMSISKTSFLDRTADLAQMVAKSVVGIGGSFLEIIGKLQLLTQRFTGLDSFGLFSLCLPDLTCDFE